MKMVSKELVRLVSKKALQDKDIDLYLDIQL